MNFDKKNGNTKWQDAIKIELRQITEYESFIDKGYHTKTKPPPGYKNIRVHLIFMSSTMDDTTLDLWPHSLLRWYLSLLIQSLENLKDIFLLLGRRYMDILVAVLDGLIDSPTVSWSLASSHAILILTIWMRKNGDIYEYVAVYVDDLAITMKDPQ
jgi:hypothetical protein